MHGGNPLYGRVRIQGAKNAVLPILAGTVLVEGVCIIRDVPKITDVHDMLHILSGLGAKIQWRGGDLHVDTRVLYNNEINAELAGKLRGSVFLLGSMLGRFGEASMPMPGGCNIGARPIDLHILGLRGIGAQVKETKDRIECRILGGSGGTVYLDFPSVGATLNLIMAGTIGDGIVKIVNAAKEPEILDVATFLNAAGACITGAGTDTITIQGVSGLRGVDYTPIPDRINTGTFMVAVAATGGEVTLENTIPEHNANLVSKLRNMGVVVKTTKDTIIVKSKGKGYKSVPSVQTAPYPGFSTDLQSQFAALSTITSGRTSITENLYENRFKYANELVKLGGRVCCITGRSLNIIGPRRQGLGTVTQPVEVSATDLRAGAALVILALASKGITIINNAHLIARGHEDIKRDLGSLGAVIYDTE